jgi:K+/H+ antiporter YhaU regulatory subunit KhtT
LSKKTPYILALNNKQKVSNAMHESTASEEAEIVAGVLNNLLTQKESLRVKAKMLVGEYWEWFTNENKNISKLRRVGMTDLNVSSIAPVVEARKSGESNAVYIVWKNHSATFRARLKNRVGKKKNASIPIHAYTSRTIPAIIQSRCGWETSKALEYEAKFELIRTALKGLHESEVKLRAASRRINKLNAETTLGE